MIRVAISVTICDVDNSSLAPEGGASSYVILDKEDYWNIRYEEVLERLMGTARAKFNSTKDKENQILG